MIVFEGNPGRVVVLPDKALAASIRPMMKVNPTIDMRGQRSVVTRVTVAQNTNAQFLHTLGGDIHIYVFGDRIGQMTISGLSFSREGSPDNCGVDNTPSGMERMLEWYKTNKLSARKDPVVVQIGNTPINGFVLASTLDVIDAKASIAQYSLTLNTIPERTAVQ